jgi:hypothetical protein
VSERAAKWAPIAGGSSVTSGQVESYKPGGSSVTSGQVESYKPGGSSVTSGQVESYKPGGLSVTSCLSVIQVFVKTLNLCIIKPPESPVPADPYAKSRVFWSSKNHREAARPGDHFLSERPEKCVPMAGG